MPELPEVETIRRYLATKVCGMVITGVEVRDQRLRQPVDTSVLRGLVGRRMVAFGRRGKYLLVHLDDGRTMVVHLGMSGHVQLCPRGAPAGKHDHVVFTLGSDTELRYNDPRRFGAILVVDDKTWGDGGACACLGPEPFDDALTVHYLQERAAGRRVPVKVFLMDGRVVAGVGNIYANEALYKAGINPQRPACSLSEGEWRRLRRAIRGVLRAAIKQGGTTLLDEGFRNPAGEGGYFQVRLAVYGREGSPCRRCGFPLVRTVVARRSTYYCPRCQR